MNYDVNPTEAGKYRANPKASAYNNFKVTYRNSDSAAECCDEGITCKDELIIPLASGASITGITYDGVAYLMVNDVRSLHKAYPGTDYELLLAAPGNLTGTQLATAAGRSTLKQFVSAVASIYEVEPVVIVAYDGTNLTIRHYGSGTISAASKSAGAANTVTRCCTLVSLFVYKASVEGAFETLYLNDLSANEVMANTPYDYAGVPATDAATAAQLKTDVEAALTALGVNYIKVSVTVDEIAGAFVIEYSSTDLTTYIEGTKPFTLAKNYADFVC